VEYPQVVVITQKLYDPNSELGGASQRVYFESTVAHEIAHQWFYGLVGDDQLNQPWLDESMAQYDTYLYYLDNIGSAVADGFKSSWEDRWGRVNRANTPIGLPVAAYTEQSYGAIVYGRGPLFLDALDQQMGEPKFKTFMKDYFQDYEWGIATTAGFEQLATKDCGCDLSGLFKEWVGE
jgi:aminopeptidase N